MELKKMTRISMLLAISIVVSILESFIPILGGMIPGVKLGLANVVVLLTLYIYGFKEAFSLSILRVILVGILRTGLFGIPFFFSLFGAIFSILSMFLVKKTSLSIVGVSIIGSITHSFGQILFASIFIVNYNILYYLPIIFIVSIITGIIVGVISKECVKFFKENC